LNDNGLQEGFVASFRFAPLGRHFRRPTKRSMLPVLPVIFVDHAEQKTKAAAIGKSSDNAPAFWAVTVLPCEEILTN
jgi:hypothetical protein